MRARLFVFIVTSVLLGGCSSSDSQAGPTQACNQVLDETCTLFARCGVATKDDCMSQGGAALDCSKAVGTSSNLQACLDAIPKVDCATLPTLPSVCQGVIQRQKDVSAPPASEPQTMSQTNAIARTIVVAP